MKNNGFTLIELMIVVAVIAILAMFAVPAYQDYLKRVYVAEAIQLSGGIKTELTEFYVTNGRLPQGSNDPMPTSIVSPNQRINRITYNGVGVQIVFNNGFTASGGDAQVFLTPITQGLGYSNGPYGSILWFCYTHSSSVNSHSQSMPYEYLPSECRNDIASYMAFY